MTAVPSSAFLRLLEVLDRLEIPYMVVGSGAAAIHGRPRMTRDVDLVARIEPEQIEPFVEELQSEFYIDELQIREALRTGRSFNVIHLASSFKFDIFPASDDPYSQAQLGRRRFEASSIWTREPAEFAVIAPEDLILGKLQWYRQGGEVSEQQWNDVLAVLAVQRERLDLEYMRRWAAELKVAELLERALQESRQAPG